MNQPPAFQFYPKDFLADINVASMSMEERGIYITLLSYCWIEGWLPSGSTKLQRLCNNPLNWEESWGNISPCFYEKDGKLYHKRLEEERRKQIEWREKSREGGIKSGEARRQSKGGSRVVEPNANQRATLQSSSSTTNKESIIKNNTKEMAQAPSWLPKEEFSEFKKMRTRLKKPMTDKAEELIIKKLETLMKEGFKPKEVLEQSIMNSWQGVFPLKEPDGKAIGKPIKSGFEASRETSEEWLERRRREAEERGEKDYGK